MKIERTIEIDAPPEKVYEVVMDPRRLDEWVTIHHGLETKHNGRLKHGHELIQRLKVAGQKFKVHWKVAEDKKPDRVVWEGKGPMGTKAKVVYDFEARDGGTRFCYFNEYHAPGGALGALAARTVSGKAGSESEKSLERLKRLIERQ